MYFLDTSLWFDLFTNLFNIIIIGIHFYDIIKRQAQAPIIIVSTTNNNHFRFFGLTFLKIDFLPTIFLWIRFKSIYVHESPVTSYNGLCVFKFSLRLIVDMSRLNVRSVDDRF